MNCKYFGCTHEERGMPIIHDALITPEPLHLCNTHTAELIGYLNARDALALEKFAKQGDLGMVIIKDSLVTIASRAVLRRREFPA